MAKSHYPCPKCGAHVEVVGRNRSNADWLARKRQEQGEACPDCSRAEYRAKYEAEAAAAAAGATGLPAITQGSDKQIAFAITCRARLLSRLAEAEAILLARAEEIVKTHMAAAPAAPQALQEARDAVALVLAEYRARTAARDWIDERDDPADTIAQRLGEVLRKRGPALMPTLAGHHHG